MNKNIEEKKDKTNSYIEDKVVLSFTKELQKRIPDKLKSVILYGSRARKDNDEFSDYDFMVLLKQRDEEIIETIFDIGYDILDRFNVLVSCLIWDEEDYEFHKPLQIGKNIEKEGILIL